MWPDHLNFLPGHKGQPIHTLFSTSVMLVTVEIRAYTKKGTQSYLLQQIIKL